MFSKALLGQEVGTGPQKDGAGGKGSELLNADLEGRARRQEEVKGTGKAGEEGPGWPKGSEPRQFRAGSLRFLVRESGKLLSEITDKGEEKRPKREDRECLD